ncbi:sialate O-acetylesterase [uncultured Caulobacter sp.]|uniref:sialate O-acetylesterase n=1 Tax=uncultured Caulobacter sp. TaxID=158749 RepID=UPI00261243C5|nr:sialate O-acetylesterase [uncultured Caulobacter sp.]
MRKLSLMLGAGLAIALSAQARAEPLLAPVFQDHAVVQRDGPIPVWGKAAPGAKVGIRLNGVEAQAVAGADGRWRANLPAIPAGGPYELQVTAGAETQTVRDVLVGDVLLCSGQSNMAFPLRSMLSPGKDLSRAADPGVRLLSVEKTGALKPASALPASARWTIADPSTVPEFSAVCLLAGRQLRETLKTPIGLINASVGGSPIEDWLSAEALGATGQKAKDLAMYAAYAKDPALGQAALRDMIEPWWKTRKTLETAAWRQPAFDDADWGQITLDGRWQGAGDAALRDFDGTIWLRRRITLTAEQAQGEATLLLGRLTDMDATFVNGVWVGSDEGDRERRYRVPRGVLKAGDNLIALRVTGSYGAGGWKGGKDAKLTTAAGDVSIAGPWRYKIAAPLADTGAPPRAPWEPGRGVTNLFNGMIAPLQPYGLKAVLWYQGEQNASKAADYAGTLPALLESWRAGFQRPLPFVVVQLPNWHARSDKPMNSAWAELREAQRKTVLNDGNAALAVTIDLGEINDVHPVNKRDVATRVADQTLRLAYGRPVAAASPAPIKVERRGDTVAVTFDAAEDGLVVYSANTPASFELCDAARRCRFADARVDKSEVLLAVPQGFSPSFVRYAWADSPIINLYNRRNLPATPFEEPIAPAKP